MEGNFTEEMVFQRFLNNGAKLYSFPLKVEKEGKYKVRVYGGKCNITREFCVGNQYKGQKEISICAQRGLYVTRFTSIPVFFFNTFAL